MVTCTRLRVVIGQFNWPYPPARSDKIKSIFVAKLFRDLSPNGLYTYIASKSLKLPKTNVVSFA